MSILRGLLFCLGALAFAAGALFFAQGTGILPWPKQSFMIDEMPWAYRGIAIAIAGLFIVLISRRLKG